MLDERKKRILRAIIDDYILTAEPIGSRTIARKSELGISSATIRNEMADLEENGFLEQPHTSAGRIPSVKGYRFYVDCLMSIPKLSENEITLIKRWYKERARHLEEVFQETVKILSRITQNISFLTVSNAEKTKYVFKYLKFLPLDKNRVILIVVTDKGVLENCILEVNEEIQLEELEKMADLINAHFSDKDILSMKKVALNALRQQFSKMPETAEKIVNVLCDFLGQEKNTEKRKIYFGGTTQILSHPEYRDLEKMKNILGMLEEERLMCDILSSTSKDSEIMVTIGNENKYSGIKDCSIVQAAYHFDGEFLGRIAVLGPTRMEYGRIMSILDFMSSYLKEVLQEKR